MDIEQKIEYARKRYQEAPTSRFYAPLADMLRQAGQYREALALLDEGLGRHPGYITGRVIKGHTLLDSGQTEDAREVLHQVLAQDVGNSLALELLISEAEKSGSWAEAVDLLEQLVALDSEEVAWSFQLNAARNKLREVVALTQAAAVPAVEPHSDHQAGEPFPEQFDGEDSLPEASSEDSGKGSFATMTMVDIYLQQGYKSRALAALKNMLADGSNREAAQKKIDAIMAGSNTEAGSTGDLDSNELPGEPQDSQMLGRGIGETNKPAVEEDVEANSSRVAKREEEKRQFEEWLSRFPSQPGGEN